jgi:hypothetical protein
MKTAGEGVRIASRKDFSRSFIVCCCSILKGGRSPLLDHSSDAIWFRESRQVGSELEFKLEN